MSVTAFNSVVCLYARQVVHALAEEIPDDGLNSPLGSGRGEGRGCLRVDFKLKILQQCHPLTPIRECF